MRFLGSCVYRVDMQDELMQTRIEGYLVVLQFVEGGISEIPGSSQLIVCVLVGSELHTHRLRSQKLQIERERIWKPYTRKRVLELTKLHQ